VLCRDSIDHIQLIVYDCNEGTNYSRRVDEFVIKSRCREADIAKDLLNIKITTSRMMIEEKLG